MNVFGIPNEQEQLLIDFDVVSDTTDWDKTHEFDLNTQPEELEIPSPYPYRYRISKVKYSSTLIQLNLPDPVNMLIKLSAEFTEECEVKPTVYFQKMKPMPYVLLELIRARNGIDINNLVRYNQLKNIKQLPKPNFLK